MAGDFMPQWQHADQAAGFWFRDVMHFPAPVTPLNATFFQTAFSRGSSAAIGRLSMPITGITAGVHHGYVYLNPTPFQGDEAATRARFAEMQRLTMEYGATVLQDWYDTFEPRILAIADTVSSFDFGAAPTAAIARHLMDAHDLTTEVWDIHMRVNIPPMNAVFGFEEMIGGTLGEAAVAESRGLLQGFDNKSVALGQALWELARWAREAGLAETVGAAQVRQGKLVLPPHPMAAEFAARFADFLAHWGWRSDVFGEYGHPSWREDPSTPLMQLKGFLADPGARSPKSRSDEEAAARQRLERDFAARMPEPARPAFAALLPLAQQYLPVAEDHNFTIDQKFTVVSREAFLGLGRRLAAEGRLGDAEDIFFLTGDEIAAIADGRTPDDLRARADARRRDRAAQARIQAPPFLGTPPPADMPPDPVAAKFFGVGLVPSDNPRMITGHAASAGTATGIARIVRSLDEAGKLQPGDIMVCRMTMPAWTPLFGQVAAVVTDAGGALSHSAIVAREYRIPCVVGTVIATNAIPDGSRIHVDGTAGTVQVLD